MVFPSFILGNWDQWEPWSQCSSTCETGVQYRHRNCNADNVKLCNGKSLEKKKCNVSGSDGCSLPEDKGQLVRGNGMQFALRGSVSPLKPKSPIWSNNLLFSLFKNHIGPNGSPGLSALALAGMESKNGTDTAFIPQKLHKVSGIILNLFPSMGCGLI